MNINKMVELIQQNENAFYNSSIIRQLTSQANKTLHELMILEIDNKDWQHVAELLENKFYHKPLEGVIFCMEVDLDTKQNMLNTLWGVV